MNQKFPPITKHANISQESRNFFYQLGNIKSLNKKLTKSKKYIKTLQEPLKYCKTGIPIYQIQIYHKASPITKHTNITQESPNLY